MKRVNSHKHRRRGFTLIELLVVIAIIAALLVSILMPSLQKAKELAKDVVCRSNQKTVVMAVVLYTEEFDGQYPYETNRATVNSDPFAPNIDWAVRVGIIPDEQMPDYFEPDSPHEKIAKQGYVEYNWYNWYVRSDGAFKCPAALDQVHKKPPPYWPDGTMGAGWGSCFSMNGGFSPRTREVTDGAPDDPVDCINVGDVKRQAVLIADGNTRFASYPNLFIRSRFVVDGQGNLGMSWQQGTDLPLEQYGPWPFMTISSAVAINLARKVDWPGHPGKAANLCYTDAHVESKKLKRVDSSEWNYH